MTAPLIPTPGLAEQIRALDLHIPNDFNNGWNAALKRAAALVDAADDAPATITRRDWFAGQALAGICAGYWGTPDGPGMSHQAIALAAKSYADAMVEALK